MSQHHDTRNTRVSRGPQRSLPLAGAVIVGIALVGFLLGIAEPDSSAAARPRKLTDRTAPENVQIGPAVAYVTMGSSDLRPNMRWSSRLNDLKYDRPSPLDSVTRSNEMTLAAITDRLTNRAFDGAPPVIPHQVEQQSATSCLACHADGMKLGDRVATQVSHEHFSSCTQCHVESISGGPFVPPDDVSSAFVGLDRSGPGTRASPAAPPTIPHSTWLRENCMSCHGTITRPGLRTTHPWLSNCTQCHAASAELDQSGPWTP